MTAAVMRHFKYGPAPTEAARILGEAWKLWTDELVRGVDGQQRLHPSTWSVGPLHRAVCCEATAREYDAVGLPTVAEEWRQKGVSHLGDAL
jgi:hypothetical protein